MKWSKKIDSNQNYIVDQLRKVPGVTVHVGVDDIFVGRQGKNFWFELKNPDAFKKNGKIKKGALKPSQIKLHDGWRGHYSIVSTLEEIVNEIFTT